MIHSRVSLAIAAVVIVGAAPQGRADAIDLCAAEKADSARLACFDREVAARHAAATPAHKGVQANVGPEDAQPHKVPQESRTPLERPEPLVARVTAIRRASATESAFELDNGQVWVQVDSAAGLDIRPQDSITIKPGVLGSFFLTTGHKQTIRVRRIR